MELVGINEENDTKISNNIKKIIVHGGIFHADDVACVALMRFVNPDIEYSRVFKVPEDIDNNTIVADIGCGRYDHHQNDARLREEGTKYAACGLVYEDMADYMFKTEHAKEAFLENFILPIEYADNGVFKNPLSHIIAKMNPNWERNSNGDEEFGEAVEFLYKIFRKEVEYEESSLRAVDEVTKAYNESKDGIVVLDRFAPYGQVLIDTDSLFVIFPSNRGGYCLRCLPKKDEDYACKENLPEQWLEEKPKGCSFVHPALFIASFDTEEDAYRAAVEIVNRRENYRENNIIDDRENDIVEI